MQLLLLLLDIYKLKLCFLYILQMENRGWWHYLTPTPVTAVWRLGRTVWAVLTLLGLTHPHANCHHHDTGDHTDYQSCHLHHNSCQHWNRNTLELVIVVEKYLMYSSLGAIYVKAFTIKLKASNNRTQNFHSGDQCIFEAFSDRRNLSIHSDTTSMYPLLSYLIDDVTTAVVIVDKLSTSQQSRFKTRSFSLSAECVCRSVCLHYTV